MIKYKTLTISANQTRAIKIYKIKRMYYKTKNYKPLKKEEILLIFQIQKILDKQEQNKDNNSNQFFLATKNQNLIVKIQQK